MYDRLGRQRLSRFVAVVGIIAATNAGCGVTDGWVCSPTDPGPDGSPSCTHQWDPDLGG